jgi:apolipoprotein N-acyltransferase
MLNFAVSSLARWWLLGGSLLTLGFAPFHLWPLGLAALVLWVWGVRQAPTRKAAFTQSLLWGMAHGVTALYWLPWAFWHDSESLLFAVLGGAPAALGLAFWGALGYALVAVVAWRWRGNLRAFAGIILVGVVLIEILRNLTPFGFPWLPLGAIWAGSAFHNAEAPLLAQLASVGSVQLLSALILLLALLLASFQRRAWWAAAILLASVWAFGAWRVAQPLPANTPTETLRLVQPNLGVATKWDPVQRWQFLATTLHIATTPPFAAPQMVVLPETAVPFFLAQVPQARDWLAEAFPSPTQVLTGTVRRTEGTPPQFYNSLQLVAGGDVQASYDKQLLVPFGEFIPLRQWLEAMPLPTTVRTLSQSRLDFTHGTLSPLLPSPLGPVVGLICYEGIFPLFVAKQAQGARWLANVTNDAWFTGTTALYQHAALQRLRAIELGLPLVRSANTGISLVVDAHGREVAALPPNTAGMLDVVLPAALPNTPWRTLITRLLL